LENFMIRQLVGSGARAALALMVCGGLAACAPGSSNESDSDSDTYKIGALVALTGAYAQLGETELAGSQAYVKKLNDEGGVNGKDVELVVKDSQSDESAAIAGLRELAQDGVIGIVGPASTAEALAVRPVAEQLEIPVMTYTTSEEMTEGSTVMFKNFPSPRLSSKAQLLAAKEEGAKTFAAITQNTEYGESAVAGLDALGKELGLEYLGEELYDPAATDMTPELTKLRQKNPDALLVPAIMPANAVIAKNIHSMGFETMVFQGPGAAGNVFLESAGKAGEGQYVQGSKTLVPLAIPSSDPLSSQLKTFANEYQDLSGKSPDTYAGTGWDAMMLIAEALDKGDVATSTDEGRKDLLDSLNTNIKNFSGLNHIYDFSSDMHYSDSMAGMAIYQVQDGEFVPVMTEFDQ
jgi:branched-chain amino acid transport system substrate-binding protein